MRISCFQVRFRSQTVDSRHAEQLIFFNVHTLILVRVYILLQPICYAVLMDTHIVMPSCFVHYSRIFRRSHFWPTALWSGQAYLTSDNSATAALFALDSACQRLPRLSILMFVAASDAFRVAPAGLSPCTLPKVIRAQNQAFTIDVMFSMFHHSLPASVVAYSISS